MDVVVDSAPPGERARYNLAKALSQLDPPSPTFSTAQQAINIPHAVLMDGVTRETGRRLLATVKELGGRASMAPHVEQIAVEDEPGSLTNFLVVIVLVGAIAFALYAWTWRLRNPTAEAVKPVGASSERAARAATVARVAPLELDAIAKKAAPGIVTLRCRSASGGEASGFLVGPDLLLTSQGALCPSGEAVRVTLADGREIRGETERRDERLGLALVRIPNASAEALPVGDASVLRAGDRVVLFEGAEPLQGTVVETTRSVLGVGFLRINPAAASPGGPVLDGLGRVVGVIAPPQVLASEPGLALPVNYVYSGIGGDGGDGRLTDPPTRLKPDVAAWNNYLVEVLDADREEVQLWAPQPALLAVNTVPGRGRVATFLQHAVERPEPQTLQLTVGTPDRPLCQVSAYVVNWSPVGSNTPAARSLYFRWLRSNGLLQDAWQGFATLDLSACPQRELLGAEISLDGGDPRADRLRL